MMPHNEPPQTTSANPPVARTTSPAKGLFIAALLVFLLGSLGAWLQPPRLFPLQPPSTAEWWLHPVEQNAFQRLPRIGGELRDVFVVPDTGGIWAVGANGLIVHSQDGGRTWVRQKVEYGLPSSATKSLPSPATQQTAPVEAKAAAVADFQAREATPILNALFFTADGWRGWAVGGNGTILASSDGGQSWNPQASGTQESLTSVTFAADGQHGWAVGKYGTILASSDGGRSWNPQASGIQEDLYGVAFTANGQHGWVVGDKGTILASSDGGQSWNRQASGTPFDLYGVTFTADGQRGWAVGGNGTILASSDGGRSWNPQASGTTQHLFAVAFADDGQRGWAAGWDGTIHATTDGGRSWRRQSSGTTKHLSSVAFTADGQRGWATGTNGTILASTDGGASWNRQSSEAPSLFGIAFAADQQQVWAAGLNGTVLSSSDGGRSWEPQSTGTDKPIANIAFATDGQHGFAATFSGTFLTTRDGGLSWNQLESGAKSSLSAIAFSADGQHGWAAGSDGRIIASSDGGQSWHQQTSGTSTWLLGLASAAEGQRTWAVGNEGTILASTDGGLNWKPQSSGTQQQLTSVSFNVDGQYGWVAGANGTILASTDGGRSWKPQTSGTQKRLNSVTFTADSLRGWAVGDQGTILASGDGGKTWNPQFSGTPLDLRGVAFAADGLHGWVAGDRQTLLTTTDGGKMWSPVPYHYYPAPWYWLVCLPVLILAGLGTRRPKEGQLEVTVADVLASDRPLRTGDADPLDYGAIAAGISRFLRNPKTLPPLTVAVTGEWGTGKSSLMNLLWEDLRRAGFTTVWFNAWHHQKGEQLLASLFANIRAQAIPPWFSRCGLGFRWNLLYLRSLRHSLLFVALLVVFSASLAYLYTDFEHCKQVLTAGPWSKLEFNADGLKAVMPLFGGFGVLLTVILSLLNAMKGFGLDPAKLIATVSSGMAQRKPIEPGARYQFAGEFADVTQALAPGRLVIFIDDLDRCSKESVLEVLETINFLVSSGDCFIVLGMSRDWVETCVGLGFKELAEEHNHGEDDKAYRIEFARKYLQKLINIEVPLPKMDAGDSLRLLPDKKALPEPGNRFKALWDGSWGWLWHHRHAWMLLGLVAFGVTGGRWLSPQIGKDLDWMSGKINGVAEVKAPPAEIPLSSAFDLKLVEAGSGALKIGFAPKPPNGGGKTDARADSDGQWLLRTSPEALEKGVVLGKLGDQDNGAELVLKRRKEATPEFVGPPSPPATGPDPVGTPESASDKGAAFTPGAVDDSPSRAFAWTPTAGLLLALGLALLLRSPVKLTHDSEIFVQALKTWHPLIAASCPTPRMVKRYLNWVRFLAMRYRPREKEMPGFWAKLLRRKPGKPAKPSETSEDKPFDEHILVALSAIYQFRKEWVVDSAKFGQLMNGGITAPIHFVTEAFASLTPEDWQKAAEQRARFIEAVGDVEVV